MKKIVVLLFVTFMTFSCTKEDQYLSRENTLVEGVLLSAVDRSPIPNGKVLLLNSYQDGTLNSIFTGRGYRIRNVLTTNEDGRFYHSFKHADDTLYAIAAEADGFFSNRNSGGFDYPNWRATGLWGVEKGRLNYFNSPSDERKFVNNQGVVYNPEIRLAPKGWIKFKIKNETPAFSNDIMKLGGEGSNGQLINFSGSNVNTQYLRGPVRAGRFVYVGYNVTSQGNFQFYEDSIFAEPHDTVIYVLSY